MIFQGKTWCVKPTSMSSWDFNPPYGNPRGRTLGKIFRILGCFKCYHGVLVLNKELEAYFFNDYNLSFYWFIQVGHPICFLNCLGVNPTSVWVIDFQCQPRMSPLVTSFPGTTRVHCVYIYINDTYVLYSYTILCYITIQLVY